MGSTSAHGSLSCGVLPRAPMKVCGVHMFRQDEKRIVVPTDFDDGKALVQETRPTFTSSQSKHLTSQVHHMELRFLGC